MDTQTASRPSRNGQHADGDPFAAPPPGRARRRDDELEAEDRRWAPGPLERLAGAIARGVRRRVPAADLDERDPDFIRETLPGQWLLASLWFRGEVRGLGNVPEEGPVLLVGNHSGGNVSPDSLVFTLAFSTYFGVERRFHQLAHNLVLSMPGLGFLRKYGAVAASPENAARALDAGAAVLVYPGGDHEVHRPTWEANTVNFAGRRGFVRLALEHDVPIVPVVAIGGQETALFLGRGEALARLLMLDKLFRLKVLPLSIAVPWGLNVGDVLGHIPLPAKITVEVLPAVHLREQFGPSPNVDEVYEHITETMQETLDALASERRLPIVG
ncbi:MAG TPA: lysophospholipid acyltransferase family protein [Solirubrobacteraceae bacterium]|nr:lysophospholipid acyltransferase family protein [Solirubrobacteraceae bacterium]